MYQCNPPPKGLIWGIDRSIKASGHLHGHLTVLPISAFVCVWILYNMHLTEAYQLSPIIGHLMKYISQIPILAPLVRGRGQVGGCIDRCISVP